MNLKDIEFILDELCKLYPSPKTELEHRNPYELLVATMLSAQCTDKRVNLVTPELFRVCPSTAELAEIDIDDLKYLIKSINFFNNKAVNLKRMAQILQQEHNGEVPKSREALEALPGVGRKTANVVLANAFGIPALAVDTHVYRVTNRLGIVHEKEPLKTEQALLKVIPKKWWIDGHHLFILHGRRICIARKPKCEECPVRGKCEYYKKLTQE
ncbi:MAG: endonuclease III [Candidatus Gracilibacteria bacterium]